MWVLAIDTALEACTVALGRGGEVVHARSALIGVGHAEHIAPMTAALLAESAVSPRDVSEIAVVVGPGAFAGVRVGVAFARGFAIGGTARVTGATSLAAIAWDGAADGLAGAVIDARRGGVYAALYDCGATLIAPFVAPADEAMQRMRAAAGPRPISWRGPGARLFDDRAAEFRAIDPAAIIALAARRDAPPAKPLYLRPPDASPARASRFASLVAP